jgi:predicted nuclease of predicted toxin-antitoxin system
MKVLLDECVDWRLARDLPGHDVSTTRQMGWAAVKNGELLALASGNFDAFVTVDRKLPTQQNLRAFKIAVVVLRARTNRLVDLRPLVPALLAILPSLEPGTSTIVGLEAESAPQ